MSEGTPSAGKSAALPLEVTPVLLVREHWNGEATIAPVVAPELSTAGDLEAALFTQRTFLTEYFARCHPETMARMALPEGTTLREVRVGLPTSADEESRGPRTEITVSFPCVTIPAGDAVWVIAPTVEHTFYVEKAEPLDDVIRSEIRRIVVARELSTYERGRLLPARTHALERLTIPLGRMGREEAARGVSLRKQIAERESNRRARGVLAEAGAPLHNDDLRSAQAAVVARTRELETLSAMLGGTARISVLIVGKPEVGKSALLRAWIAAEHAAGRERFVYATSGAELMAGASAFGGWQDHVLRVMDAARAVDAILYFENVEDLLAERTGGRVDVLSAMKPFLDDARVRIVAEADEEVVDRLQARNEGFFACFTRLNVAPLSPRDALEALTQRSTHDRRTSPHRAQIDRAALPIIVDLAERYLPSRSLPGKAIRLYDELRAQRETEMTAAGETVTLRADDLYTLFSLQTGVPAFLLREREPLAVADVEAALRAQIVGQDEAVRRVAETIAVVKAGLQPAQKPLATFLFVGPTGVGKTELARALARFLFGSPDRLLRFDMSEFGDPYAAERLIRGSDRDDGLLTRAIREQPFAILLLDEIEKAHPAVFDLLLQLLGEGRLTDARGRLAHFQNAIVIMTSNLGARAKAQGAGFSAGTATPRAHYERHVAAAFRPELVNRIDRVVAFSPLTRDEAREVTRLALDRIRARRGLDELGVTLAVSDLALEDLATRGYSEAYGARALRRHLDDAVVDPIARLLAGLGAAARDLAITITATAEGGAEADAVATFAAPGLVVAARRRQAKKAARDLEASSSASEIRRQVDSWLSYPHAEQVKERLEFLVVALGEAAIAEARRRKRGAGAVDRRSAQDAAELRAEHQRLAELWERAVAAQADVHAAEELALVALFEGRPVGPLADHAREARDRVAKVMPYVLVACEPVRDEIALLLQELDDRRAFDTWLVPLLRDMSARGWSAIVHVDGGERTAEEAWPKERRWGPPRTGDAAYALVLAPERTARAVLLRVRGPYAGVFLALEGGLHRTTYVGRGGATERAAMLVRVLGLRALVRDEDWSHPTLVPLTPTRAAELDRGPAARDFDARTRTLAIAQDRDRFDLEPGAYWQRFDRTVFAHLVLFERDHDLDRDDLYTAVETASEGR